MCDRINIIKYKHINMAEEKFKDILDKIEVMNAIELSELVKAIEEKFGVSAMAMAPVSGASSDGDEKDSNAPVDVILKEVGDQKINVIKIVKEITGVGLKDAKDIVDGAPSTVKEGVKKEEADEIKKKLESAGAIVELK